MFDFICRLELGTVGDWVGGLGTVTAALIAFWALYEQKRDKFLDEFDDYQKEIIYAIGQATHVSKKSSRLGCQREYTVTPYGRDSESVLLRPRLPLMTHPSTTLNRALSDLESRGYLEPIYHPEMGDVFLRTQKFEDEFLFENWGRLRREVRSPLYKPRLTFGRRRIFNHTIWWSPRFKRMPQIAETLVDYPKELLTDDHEVFVSYPSDMVDLHCWVTRTKTDQIVGVLCVAPRVEDQPLIVGIVVRKDQMENGYLKIWYSQDYDVDFETGESTLTDEEVLKWTQELNNRRVAHERLEVRYPDRRYKRTWPFGRKRWYIIN